MKSTALIIANSNPPRDALAQKVRKTGIFEEVFACDSGAELMEILTNREIDLICWAIGQEEEDLDWLEALKANPAWIDLPLLVFTKEDDGESRLRGLELGACDGVTFVTSTAELAARFQNHLQRSRQIRQLRHRRAQLAELALSDPLTGLGNRTTFDLRLGQEVVRCRRNGQSFALLLLDLDRFKWFNDCYGHQAGDTILKSVADTLSKTVRDSDVACRYGGEEFAIILPDTTQCMAENLAGRLREALAELSQELWQNQSTLTASIGLTSFDASHPIGSSELISEADAALYQAKNNGRDRTESYQRPRQNPQRRPYESIQPASIQLQAP